MPFKIPTSKWATMLIDSSNIPFFQFIPFLTHLLGFPKQIRAGGPFGDIMQYGCIR